MIVWSLLLLGALVACSLLVSGSETALFALTARDRAAFAVSAGRFKRGAARLMRKPRNVLTTVLIVNTAVNIGIFSVSYITFARVASTSPSLAALAGVVTLGVVLLFGEVLPKALALANARRLAPLAAPMIEFLQALTAIPRAVLDVAVIEPITRLLQPRRFEREDVTAADLRALVELSSEQAIITSYEHDMLQAIVTLPDTTVRAIMVPRVNLLAIPHDAEPPTVRALFRETGLKKVPVFGRDLDEIRGILYARDFYLHPDTPVENLLRSARYVPEMINLLQLIAHFQRSRSQHALVVDEYGGVSGLVTLEDVLEEIVGELEEEAPPQEQPPLIERVDDTHYRLSGALSVRPWRQALGLGDRFSQVETMGGIVVAALGRMARVGDAVRFGNLTVHVEAVAHRRVERVLIEMWTPQEQDPAEDAAS